MSDPILIVVELLFGILFATSLWTAVRHRDRLAWDVALVFMPLAALLIVQLVGSLGPTPEWLSSASVVFLLAQPVFSLKLAADIRPVPRAVLWLAVAGFAASAVALNVLESPAQPAAGFAAVGVFVVTEVVAAAYLAGEARRRSGAARMRLLIAALGTVCLGLALFVAGAAPAANVSAEVTDFATRAIALVAAGAYWIAFLPPRWVRELFQAREAYRYQERLLSSPPSAQPAELWADLAHAASTLTGAGIVVLGSTPVAPGVLATDALELSEPLEVTPPPEGGTDADRTAAIARDLAARTGMAHVTIVPMRLGEERVGSVALLRRKPSLFGADDAPLVASLAARSANLVRRREALSSQERLTEQLRVTVAALEAASAAKSDFLASMSHELRTPLNAIIGFSELMIVEAGNSDTVTAPREWVDHIRNGGTHLVALINDVLDLAKVEAGRLELTKVPVDLAHAVTESVAGLRPLAERKRQALAASVESVTFEVDPGRLRQILYNLLSNAIKYTPEEGSIAVTATHVGDEVRISVADTGVGISEEDQPHVFDEFRQVGDRAGHAAGTGLGLALTRRLVDAHGGRIELMSTPGEGSTFTVILPVGATATPEQTGDERPRLGDGAGARVLVIEDDPSSVRLLQTYLADGGYEVRVAVDGERGLEMARADPPAAILLDILLPGIDGWEVLRRLKSDPRVRDIPVVIITVVDERNVGLALGAVDYFVKPIEREALVSRLDRHTFTTKVRTRTVDIVAIDDDPATLAMIDATLVPLGFTVRLAASGPEGLDLVEQRTPDLVICDLMMPDLDGFAVVARLHDNPATAALPILILTAHELTESDKARLNGQVLGVVDKGATAAQGLLAWLARVAPEAAPGAAGGASTGSVGGPSAGAVPDGSTERG